MMRRVRCWLLMVLVATWQATPAIADSDSNAAIRARPADLAPFQVSGDGVGIVQIDTEMSILHPGIAANVVSMTDFTNEGLLSPDTDFFAYVSEGTNRVWVNDFHATAVAGVMVGNGLDSGNNQTSGVGVAPGANLDTGKMWTSQLDKNDPIWGTQALLALSTLVGPEDPYRVAILEDQSSGGLANGSGLFSLAADYAAWARDITVVIPAGNSGAPADGVPFSRPADAFNGITVGATDATYTRVADFSNSGVTSDARFKPDVVAPGVNIYMPFGGWEDDDGRDASAAFGYSSNVGPANISDFKSPNINATQDVDPDYVLGTGTSFAAPHVAGQVALLQEYGRDNGLDIHSQTMRAVVINSADKIANVLQADETVTDKDNANWLESQAYSNQFVPLDFDMGAGQADVWRSLTQYAAGQHAPGDVPAVGWDYHVLGNESDYYDYVLDAFVPANGYVSATLDWRREVTFTDVNNNGLYDSATDSLAGLAADVLHLYLMPADSNDLNDAVWSSTSYIDNLQHIFRKVDSRGQYKLRVVFEDDRASAETHYGLAWWAATVPEPSTWMLLISACACIAAVRRRLSQRDE